MKPSDEIATNLLGRFDLADDRRALLIKRLTNVIDLTQSHKDGKAFQAPPGKTEANKQLKKLAKALCNVRSTMEAMSPIVFEAVNRSLCEGDIPLLDEGSAKHSRLKNEIHRLKQTDCEVPLPGELLSNRISGDIPANIAEVLYDLSGHLLNHVQAIKPAEAKKGPSDDFTRFLASELATVYAYASQSKPTDRTDCISGAAYGPFYEFVDAAKRALSLDISAEYLVDKATQPNTYANLIRVRSSLPIEKGEREIIKVLCLPADSHK